MTSTTVQKALRLFDDDSDDEEVEAAVPSADVHLEFTTSVSVSTSSNVDMSSQYQPALWTHLPPDFFGPMEYRANADEFGGGRGYYAAEDVPAGTLLLRERAYVLWPDVDDRSALLLATVEQILQSEDADEIASNMAPLHPVVLEDLPKTLLDAAHEEYDDSLTQLLTQYGRINGTDDDATLRRWLQVVLGMQCNAFTSGVFLHTAMFNHDCNPNCVKFSPESGLSVSEVRAAKAIKKGEQLFISYIYPREQSRERRQAQLVRQFGFVCHCPMCGRGDSFSTPPQSPSSTSTPLPQGPDKTLEEIETDLGVLEDLFTEHAANNAPQVLHAALEALSDLLELVAHDHVVMMRVHKLVADSCDSLLKLQKNVQEHAILFVRSCVELLELQRLFLDHDHIDLARTLNDISQGIRLLLSYNPQVLLDEFPEWSTFRQASLVESQYTKEYKRIKALYE
ncbi:hypothetical protein H310_06423 [Aphanomyces invadans]|uniref:SET domain-containing protein n=1 Tax=Aphanomyces invadans TaxID=157072 RepID=A0A024U6G3_9STRA|nr:hypothetical protein H310_06423 [Aphanomyces invadans]ETW01854.1 hypothetical protein H310_06423 [Aphanomyces invadans]|eukprot:XP_008869702.1 hypothetical protein H310_06423 [Aphanomyces invadans]